MQEVFNFIFRHFEAILSIVLIILSFVILIIRKKPVNSVLSHIYAACTSCINDVEASGVIGSTAKKQLCIKLVKEMLKLHFPDLDVEAYTSIISDVIENILNTPHKKGV